MRCKAIRDKDGNFEGIMCGSFPPTPKLCLAPDCTELTKVLCDFVVGPGKTCDVGVCLNHAEQQGPNRDYCYRHGK